MDERVRQFRILTKVKTLREEKALDALQAARRALAAAEARHATLKREVELSKASLPQRIEAVYTEVIGSVVDQDALGAVQQRASELDREQLLLADRCDRAGHMVESRRQALSAAACTYRLAQRNREKFDGLLGNMVRDAANDAAARQEIEVEDLFTSPRSPLKEAS